MTRRGLKWIAAITPEWIVVLMLALAFAPGVQTTRDLNWPGDVDLFRDIGHAQTIVDGDWFADPQYRGETVWYSPLTPTIVAIAAKAIHQPVPLIYTRLGVYLNLLAPLAFYVLIATLFDRWTAVAALFAFLFVAPPTNEPSWAMATYSPWLFAANFAQTWLYLTLAAYVKAWRSQRWRWTIIAGVLLGVTFLSHTAPTMMAVGIIALHTLAQLIRPRNALSRQQTLLIFGAVIGLALIVSAPFLVSIVGRYQLHVLNPAPSNWAYEPLTLRNFEAFVRDNTIGQAWFVAIVIVGVIAVVRDQRPRSGRSLTGWWLILALGLLAYHYVRQLARRSGVILPGVVPGFHFLIYLRGVEWILFGCGLAAIVRTVFNVTSSSVPRLRGRLMIEHGAQAILLAVLLAALYPAYLTRDDFAGMREEAIGHAQDVDQINAYEWLRANTEPTDVFLVNDTWGTYVVSPAGRKLVAADSYYSSPYVDWAARNADRQAMFNAIDAQDATTFQPLADKYHAHWVIVSGNRLARLTTSAPAFLQTAYANDSVRIYRIMP